MHRLFETLEGRWMLSSTTLGLSVHVAAHPPAVHAPLSQSMPMRFQGTATDTMAGKTVAQLQMMVVKTGKGYQATLVSASAGAKPMHFAFKVNAAGSFSFDKKENGSKLHLEGSLGADLQTVAGTFTQTGTDGSSSGTFSLTRLASPAGGNGDGKGDAKGDGGQNTTPPSKNPEPTPSPNPSPVPTPTPMPVSGQVVSHYVGAATGSAGGTTAVTLDLVKTPDGGSIGVIRSANSTGTTGALTVKFDAKGHFVLDATDHSPRLEGQLSVDMKTIAGTFTGANASEGGTFALTRT